MSEVREILVVGAAIIDGERCLVTQRSASMSNPLKWEFPGGKPEPGERTSDALVREIREELGVDIQVGASIGMGEALVLGTDVLVRLYVFAATIVGGELELREHADSRWCTADELDGLDWAAADVPIVPKVGRILERAASA